jgi:carboxyl-terminal processing protease
MGRRCALVTATPLWRTRHLLSGGFAFVFTLVSLPVVAATGVDDRAAQWRARGAEHEKRGAWYEACRCYDEALRHERQHPSTREAYQRCARRLNLVTRHRDPAYTEALGRLSYPQALEIYVQVLGVVRGACPDRSRTSPTALFQQGLQEVRFALEERIARQKHLGNPRPDALARFKAHLEEWSERKIVNHADARLQVLTIVNLAQRDGVLQRDSHLVALVMEFAAGACNAPDEYSSFLSPGHLGLLQAALRGQLVSVGLEVGLIEDKIQVTRVHPRSSAQESGLLRGDRVVRIDRQSVEALSAEAVAERLRGEAGTSIEVEFVRPTDPPLTNRRSVRLTRRPVLLPSVEVELQLLADTTPIGYLRINHFQDSTLQEVKEALAGWQVNGPETIKGMILDLRGNPGGAFKPAVHVAELFLSEGVIVVGESPYKDFNRPFKVEAAGPVQLPVIVLIDGETASAAEVLAGALKEVRSPRVPTRLLGSRTYGKGSVQSMIPVDRPPLDKLPGGIRLTVARLFSPSNQPYTGRGVEPDEYLQPNVDPVNEARRQLQALLGGKPLGVAMAPMPPT